MRLVYCSNVLAMFVSLILFVEIGGRQGNVEWQEESRNTHGGTEGCHEDTLGYLKFAVIIRIRCINSLAL